MGSDSNYLFSQGLKGSVPFYVDIQRGSRIADSLVFQLGPFSYIHAMSSDNLDPITASKKMDTFIDIQMDRFKRYWALGWQSMGFSDGAEAARYFSIAFEALGLGLHPGMDSTSPVHNNFTKWSYLDSLLHGSSWWSREDIDTAKQAQYKVPTIQIMSDTLGRYHIDQILENGGYNLTPEK